MAKETVKKILVIESQAETRKLFLTSLKAEGFHTISAENGHIGVQRAQQELPDLIVSEIMVPKLDGFGVLTTLRQDPTTAMIPLIFVTTKVYRCDIRKGMELGADDYITKPCTVDELLRAIASRLQRHTTLQKLSAPTTKPVTELPKTGIIKPENPQSILPSDPELKEVFRFIETNYHQPITLSDVADAVSYSPAYLTNLVRRQTGQTVQGWIIERRMAAARSLLLETNHRVEEIATQIGYYHTVHFFRQFRQYHGTTPQAWRRSQLAEYKVQYKQREKG